MSGIVVFLLIAAVLAVMFWAIQATGSRRAGTPPSRLFDVDGRSRTVPEPVRAATSARRAPKARTRPGHSAPRGRVKNPDAPCWVCSKSLADGHTH
jgi:hypothetical protein